MSYYGKADEAYTYYRSSSDDDAYYQTESRTKMAEDDKDFYGLHSAEKYYQQAFEHSADKEMKARCLFMAAKCWQKRCPVPCTGTDSWFWGSGNDAYFVYSLQSPYFTQLVQDYKGTEYFNRAFSTCSYLRAYVERH